MANPEAAQAKVSMPQKALRELLLLVQYAMAQQDIRYYLNGLLLVLEASEVKVIATDGHRLSYAARPLGQQQERREVILPRKAVLELSRLLAAVRTWSRSRSSRAWWLHSAIRSSPPRSSTASSRLHAGRADELPSVSPSRQSCCSRYSGRRSQQREIPRCAGWFACTSAILHQ
jgi:hypothetical protein